jgi:hypothetical protein
MHAFAFGLRLGCIFSFMPTRRSREVPIQGVPQGKTLPVTINGRTIRAPDIHDIDQSVLFLKESPRLSLFPDFHAVKIDWKVLKVGMRETFDRWFGPRSRPGDGAVASALQDSVQHHEVEGTRPTRTEHIAEIRQEYPGMTEAQYDELKVGIVPTKWTKPGRPPKRRQIFSINRGGNHGGKGAAAISFAVYPSRIPLNLRSHLPPFVRTWSDQCQSPAPAYLIGNSDRWS